MFWFILGNYFFANFLLFYYIFTCFVRCNYSPQNAFEHTVSSLGSVVIILQMKREIMNDLKETVGSTI